MYFKPKYVLVKITLRQKRLVTKKTPRDKRYVLAVSQSSIKVIGHPVVWFCT